MKSIWNVSSNPMLGDEKRYQVYRNIDVEAVDHSGNREYMEKLFDTEEEAQHIAEMYNEKRSFVCEFGELLEEYDVEGIKKLAYEIDLGSKTEIATITFKNGYKKDVDVTGCSLRAIISSVMSRI